MRPGSSTRWFVALALLFACRDKAQHGAGPDEGPPPQPLREGRALEPLSWPDAPLDWIAVGTGGAPLDTQVQIEQDIALAQEVLGGVGVTLFAGGPGSVSVQVEGGGAAVDPLLRDLGDLFSPRGGRASTYRRPRVPSHGAANRQLFLDTLQSELSSPGPTLTVYFAGHGLQGETPQQNLIVFWGEEDLLVADLAALLDEGTQRPLRLVMTSCYGGGFAELAFDAAGKATEAEVCGFFASPWDLPAAGCDPNPDRASQEGYGLHFLQALRGRDRSGKDLNGADVDADASGGVSFLEAHNYARYVSRSSNVPVSMSERFLLHHADRLAGVSPRRDQATPHLDHVIERLAQRLDVENPAAEQADLVQRLEAAEGTATDLSERLADAEADEADAFHRASSVVLSAFPYLDDPWHPLFWHQLEARREDIAALLSTAPEVEAYRRAVDAVVALDAELWQLRDQTAPLESLVRALQARDLARRLAARGGRDWERYLRFRACELEEPELAAPR